ncbi:hypothetical protein H311_04565, partial [Anncaliia algerae PRA109]
KDSFLSEVKIEPRVFLKSIFYILNNTQLVDIKRFLNISYKSLKIIKKLITNKIKEFFGCNPIRLGGDGIIVHVDETMLSHAVKSHRGRVARNQSWALTIVDTSEKPGLGYCQIVDKRDSTTLIPIISRIVRPGSIIHTDEWKAYIKLNQSNFDHKTIRHKFNFVDPITGIHTQNVESFNNKLKLFIKNQRGCKADSRNDLCNLFLFLDHYKNKAFLKFLELIKV